MGRAQRGRGASSSGGGPAGGQQKGLDGWLAGGAPGGAARGGRGAGGVRGYTEQVSSAVTEELLLQVNRRLAQAEEANARLRAQAKDRERELKEAAAEARRLRGLLAEREDTVQAAHGHSANFREALEEERKKSAHQAARAELADRRCGRLQEQLTGAREEAAALAEERGQLEEGLEDSQRIIANLDQTVERQRAELADAGARLDRERKRLQASQSECEGLATKRGSAITEAQDFMRTVNDDLQELTLQNMQLKEELAAANESRARMEVVNGMLKDRSAEQEEIVQALMAKMDGQAVKLARHEARVQELMTSNGVMALQDTVRKGKLAPVPNAFGGGRRAVRSAPSKDQKPGARKIHPAGGAGGAPPAPRERAAGSAGPFTVFNR